MKIISIFVLLTSYGILAAPPNETSADELTSLLEFSKGNNLYTGDLYKEVIKEQHGNFIISPFSSEIVLALINEGAVGSTSEELQKGLHLPTDNKVTQKAMKVFLPKFKHSDGKLKLLSANKIYASKDVILTPGFSDVADKIYHSEVEPVSFVPAEQAAATINEWVQQQTNNNIKDLIKPDYLGALTKLVLINALYFKGIWENSFEQHETHKEKFFSSKNSSSEVDFMQQINFFNYYENENIKAVEIPYKGDNIRLVIVLPKDIEGLSKLEENVADLFSPQQFRWEKVDLKIPKFKIETEIELNSVLQRMGIQKIFNSDADLSGLTSSHSKSLYVSKVVQKAFIKLDEKGTEAAVATAGILWGRSGKAEFTDPKEFYADHPFALYIKVDDVIIIAGAVKSL